MHRNRRLAIITVLLFFPAVAFSWEENLEIGKLFTNAISTVRSYSTMSPMISLSATINSEPKQDIFPHRHLQSPTRSSALQRAPSKTWMKSCRTKGPPNPLSLHGDMTWDCVRPSLSPTFRSTRSLHGASA